MATQRIDRYKPKYRFGRHLPEDFPTRESKGVVGVVMGSRSDWCHVIECTDMLEALQIPFEYGVVSAHRTPERMAMYAEKAFWRGLKVIIACAGGSAHLPGMVASETLLPVVGVAPLKRDEAAIKSMIEMPGGKPLAYLGGGSEPGRSAGAKNAALFSARILSLQDADLLKRLQQYDEKLGTDVPHTCYD